MPLQLFGRAHVRNAPRLVAPELVGAELGSLLRRFGAFVIDLLVWAIATLPALIFVGLLSLGLQLGGYEPLEIVTSSQLEASREEVGEAKLRVLRLVEQRNPDIIPAHLTEALASEDEASLRELCADLPMSINVQLSSGEVLSSWNEDEGELILANDVLFGERAGFVKIGGFFLVGFTLIPWLFRGRTPGKWVFGLRVVRTDGGRFGWWTAFSRAGGYFASGIMAFLGFLEAAWDPNRQAAHDKLAGTLVIRAPRFRRASASVDAP